MYKVLIVDDEYMVTEGLKRLIPFDKWDMEVVATASHADEALEYVQENPVDVIISDVNMPDKTGLDMIPGDERDLTRCALRLSGV
ncbi:response regulator [Streptococcus pneumoniae]|uniref:Response regulator n=1 Tax=Streptococcus pneumoniae TaxID=1313 RepID=A0AA86XFD2_STREE|nr:response regulator [Streptococcus pneumoniae]CIS35107.1 response regulator [Streptococcus pneumoniae]CIZ00995.1 response regulator [Streptococcus pneumoniae]CJV33251.1 response regulator [Streptococcus pneumoniae]CJW91760.1 response regulator [Streptococcus pneumoniae]